MNDYADLLARWDDLPKHELWALGSGDLHNVIEEAIDRAEKAEADVKWALAQKSVLLCELEDTQAQLAAVVAMAEPWSQCSSSIQVSLRACGLEICAALGDK